MLKKLILGIVILIVSLIGGFISFVYLSNPLVLDGSRTEYLNPNNPNNLFDITYDIYNKGSRNIEIQEVLINHASNETIELGISFDSQFVQAGTSNPNTVFFALQQHPVKPELTPEEKNEAFKKKEMKPMHYGILLKDFTGTLHTITIKYKYFGLTVTKHYELQP